MAGGAAGIGPGGAGTTTARSSRWPSGEAVTRVGTFRASLAEVPVTELSDRERVDLVAELERVKGACSAAQARLVEAVRVSREGAVPQDAVRSVGSEVALARRESPSCGDRFVRVSRALAHDLPETFAALTSGECSEAHVVKVVEATSVLGVADRAEADRRLGPLLGRLGVKAADTAARRVAAELDAAAVVARMEAAVRSRRVTMRAAVDGMAYLTVLGPMVEVAGAHAALTARARSVVAGHCDDEPHGGRSVGAVAADTALVAMSGRSPGGVQPVEVHLVMTDRALLGTGDEARSVMEPARVPGHGSLPAPAARWWLREADEGSVWLRRLYTSPDGRDLAAMDSRRRTFTGMLRRMLVLRDDVCTTPWCGAAIAHADHATPSREGGVTDFVTGNGKCVRCNQVKEAPGWTTTATSAASDDEACSRPSGTLPDAAPRRLPDSSPHELPDVSPRELPRESTGSLPARVLVIRTPSGRVHVSAPPPLLGWGSDPAPSAAQHVEPAGRGGQDQTPRTSLTGPQPSRTAAQPSRTRPQPSRTGPQRRPLTRRRARSVPSTGRRARLTSRLERELCRYLT